MTNIFILQLFKFWLKKRNPIYEMFFKDKKVLDIGCGEGELLRKNPGLIEGVDINDTVLQRLRSKGLKVTKASVTELPFTNESFEAVNSSNVIEHLNTEDAYKMISEMHRVVKKKGKLILVTPMPKTVWNSFGHIKPYTPQAIKKLLRDISRESFEPIRGLRIKQVFYYGTWSMNKITFFLSTILANLIPSLFAGSYLMILEKNEE